jgi:tetratricopeptide (TPR) repeat protein
MRLTGSIRRLQELESIEKNLLQLKQFSALLPIEEEILQLRKEIFGEKHPAVGLALKNLGSIYVVIGDCEQAYAYQSQSVRHSQELLEKQKSELSPELLKERIMSIVKSLNGLGNTCIHIGKYEEALRLNLEALGLCRTVLESGDQYFGIILSSVGSSYGMLKQYREALDYQEEALPFLQQDGDNLTLAMCYNNGGVAYGKLREHDKALENHRKALQIRKRILGEKHSEVGISLNNVGGTLYYLGNWEEALKYFLESFKLSCETICQQLSQEIIIENMIHCLKGLTDSELIQQTKNEILPLANIKLGESHPLVMRLREL